MPDTYVIDLAVANVALGRLSEDYYPPLCGGWVVSLDVSIGAVLLAGISSQHSQGRRARCPTHPHRPIERHVGGSDEA